MLKRISLLIWLISLVSAAHAGGPWTQSKGEGIAIGNISPVVYRTYSSVAGEQIDMWRRVTEISMQGYFEIGLHDRVTLEGNLILRYAGTSQKLFDDGDFNSILAPGRIFGMGNSSIGVKYRFTKGNFLFSGSFGLEFPGSSEKIIFGLRTGYDAWSFVPGIHFGQGFSNGIYYFVEGFFAAHTQISDEYRIRAEIGYDFRKPLVAAVHVHVKESLKNRTFGSSNYAQTGLYLNDQEFIAWEFKFIYSITEDLGITTALAGGFRTELIARTPVISFGVFYKWKQPGAADE